MVRERKGRVTKTLSQNNGKNGIDINGDAGGTGEDGLGMKSGAHVWTCWLCDAYDSSFQ